MVHPRVSLTKQKKLHKQSKAFLLPRKTFEPLSFQEAEARLLLEAGIRFPTVIWKSVNLQPTPLFPMGTVTIAYRAPNTAFTKETNWYRH